MIDWTKGITARYYCAIVNPNTWKDIRTINITSGSIKYSDSGIYESADISCRDLNQNEEYWIRLYLDARQEDEGELIPLFTGIASIPDSSYSGRINSKNVQCYSVLGPAEKVLLPLGWYVPIGSNGAIAIRDLLKSVIPAPIIIEGESPYLSSSIISESGESVVSMVNKILNSINWRISIDGDGTVRIKRKASMVSAVFDSINKDIIGLDIGIKENRYDIPNVFRAISDGLVAIARDENPNSEFSIQNRGREIWMEDRNCVLNNGEKIGQYAERRLKEEQNVYRTINYNRRFKPNIKIGDIVKINYPEQGVSGFFRITSQSLNIGYGGEISEEVVGI